MKLMVKLNHEQQHLCTPNTVALLPDSWEITQVGLRGSFFTSAHQSAHSYDADVFIAYLYLVCLCTSFLP